MAKYLEKDIQRDICDYLALKGYLFWRQNTTPIYDVQGKKFRAMPKYSMSGVADILLIRNDGKAVFIEVKRPKMKQSEGQVIFQEKVTRNNALYFVVTSLDDLLQVEKYLSP